MPPLNTAYIFVSFLQMILELSVLFHDTDIRMYDRPCYWPSQGLGPESGARPTPNLFPMEYNNSPGELDTWCWCLNKVKVILKIVQFRSRIYILRLAGWDDWLSKHGNLKMLIYLLGIQLFPHKNVGPDPVSWQIPPRHIQGLKGWVITEADLDLLELWPGFVSKTFGIPWKHNKI